VLERGARADESVSGQGIGLSVAREIAAAYSGTLEIGDSRFGGARVSLRLPGR
jgi:two-component system sensor histidine kinase PhoQ